VIEQVRGFCGWEVSHLDVMLRLHPADDVESVLGEKLEGGCAVV
jgi:hypothetical protein